ncbi:MAG: hypothetical protein Q8S18_10810 [Bacteroidales bacterium]|nr:hypothetical protein [Bacteroidales bacterium]
MKAIIITLISSIILFTNLRAEGFEPRQKDEAFIHDIPFSTTDVYSEVMSDKALNVEFEVTEESFIQDIPFDTEEIAQEAIMNEIDFRMTEEQEINDIQIDTVRIANENI